MHSRMNRYRILSAAFLISNLLLMPIARAGSLQNTASYSFKDPTGAEIAGFTNGIKQELIDPLGRIRGCGGEILPDYTGFSVGLYEAGAEDTLAGLVPMVRTGTGTNFVGTPPNVQNSNPFFLTNDEPKGAYNFLLNRNGGQLDIGKRCILVVNPPPRAREYNQRQIRMIVTNRNDAAHTVSYTATALDGKGISQDGDPTSFNTTVPINDGTTTGVILSATNLLDHPVCVGASQPIQIIKTADRAAVEPGDTMIYRLLVRNLNNVAAKQIAIADVLPTGFAFVKSSARAEMNGKPVAVTTTTKGSNLTFNFDGTIPAQGSLNLAYGVQISPDALRGSGENIASVSAHRDDTNAELRDGPSRYRVRIRSGIITDCGTLIGRVFVDQNFDGEQQPGEPGIPNAVILLDDGNRVTTDANGLFSVANVISGNRTGVLDLSSVPGYKLAPNRYVKERNSQSRLVRLEPSGLARMNFAVTPITGEAGKK